jgi:hypothetical protein
MGCACILQHFLHILLTRPIATLAEATFLLPTRAYQSIQSYIIQGERRQATIVVADGRLDDNEMTRGYYYGEPRQI